MPAMITLRIKDDVPSLRASRRFAVVRQAFAKGRELHGLRLVEFSVLSNHLHLIVEAENSESLSRGMQGLCIRLAKALNRFLRRSGGVFADHYHSVLLRTPTELVNRIAYVLSNAVHHYGSDFEACSSLEKGAGALLAKPRGWLLTSGFMRGRGPKEPRALEALRRWSIARKLREMA
ncbi:MAG TPA: hypothetical protein VH083_15130 [Myxococcales bacterium]|jgi:REP element-mobilizing transposase RayT|nr:hypothetical protein [Myxococcales bacterium]